jgi:hypothetical protein
MLHMLVAQGFAEQPVFVAGSVIGQYAPDGEAEAVEVGAGHPEEADGRLVALIGQDRPEGDAGVVVDGDVQILPAGAARLAAPLTGDTMGGFADPRQTLDIEVDQVARALVLIGNHGRRRIERTQPVHAGAAKDTAHGGPGDLEFVGDAPAVPAQPAKNQNPFQ